MAGNISDESGLGKSMEGFSSGQRCQSGEALTEWRSSEQVENGTPSTSPPYWDSDDDDDGGPKPSDLYGKYTWKIEKFTQINKRELRSNAFEVGGYKWYILIYPQGCDVCNHLSLFLCVANHDKLLPGWSHFAQFTIAVVNKDPKKSKYSDTLHRFWKKEHDWGWKKFMELTKVHDGFVDAADNLIIKAQVQVIREKADRPFRCLDCQYRRELVRVYLTNVEQNCRRFVEERRAKLGNLIEDKAKWSSFCAFWQGIDQHTRRRMSRENMDVILKVVVKHFFIEKEVTSTLVMDSLYSGLKALESQSRGKKIRSRLLDVETMPAPIIHMENDMFALMDDVLPLLERAAIEPLPPKDEKGPQNRTKDGNSGEEFNKDSIERDERRLTELGRRTVEIFVLAHIFSNKIEVAYQEAVALKRQEELIREEEAGQAESDQKTKRGASEKDKKSKKKQGKQKRNKKSKDKGREERPNMAAQDNLEEGNSNDDKLDSNMEGVQIQLEKPDNDDVSDASDSIDGVTEVLQLDSEDRDACPVNWDTDTSEVHHPVEHGISNIGGMSCVQNGVVDKKNNSIVDDSSSTCSTDSLPSVIMNGPWKGTSSPNYKGQRSPKRGKSQGGKVTCEERNSVNEIENQVCGSVGELVVENDGSRSAQFVESDPDSTLQEQSKCPYVDSRKAELVLLQKKLSIEGIDNLEGSVARDRLPNEKISDVAPSPGSPPRNQPFTNEAKLTHPVNPVPVWKPSSNGTRQNDKDVSSAFISSSQGTFVSNPFVSQTSTARLAEKVIAQQVSGISRPSTAPIAPGPRPTAPVVSMVQTAPVLARSASAAGRLGPDPSVPTPSYIPQSYRNAIVGNPIAPSSCSFTHATSSNPIINSSAAYAQQPSFLSSMLVSQSSERSDSNTSQSGLPFGVLTRDLVQNGPQWLKGSQREPVRNLPYDSPRHLNDVVNLELYKPVDSISQDKLSTDLVACTSGRQNPGLLAEEFPHLDIINDLLDDEHGIGVTGRANSFFQDASNGHQILHRQFSFPGETRTSGDVGYSTNSCRFERSPSYPDDGFPQAYSSSSTVFDSLGDYIPHPSPLPYGNGQVDGLIHNQWQMAGSDLSYLGMRNTESDAYQYYSPDYLNMACGVNGYTIFRPSNGH